MNENGVFSIKGTGAAIKLKVGFPPAKVEVINLTSATKPAMAWYRGMAAASAIKNLNAGRSQITTNGITLNPDGEEQGITIGADTDVNVAGNDLLVIVERGGEGNQF